MPWNSASSFVHSSFMARIDSRVWLQRWSKSPPMICVSSRSQPAPIPNRKRPPLNRSSVEISLASSSGLRSGTSTMPVPSFIRVVTPEARARATNGSMKCE